MREYDYRWDGTRQRLRAVAGPYLAAIWLRVARERNDLIGFIGAIERVPKAWLESLETISRLSPPGIAAGPAEPAALTYHVVVSLALYPDGAEPHVTEAAHRVLARVGWSWPPPEEP